MSLGIARTRPLDTETSKNTYFSYHDIGKLAEIDYPNGVTASFTLDSLHQLDVMEYRYSNDSLMCRFDYGYDVKSNVTSLQRDDTGAGGSNKLYSFTYDDLSRLMTASYGDETVGYSYDTAGNRLSLNSSVDGVTSYTIASNSDQLTYRSKVPEDPVFSNMSYAYDAEGNLTQRGSGNSYDSFSFDSFGCALKQIQKVRNGSVQETISYRYDGMGQRVKVTDSQGTRYFLYDGNMPLLELDANKAITASYVYGANGVIYRRKHLATGDEYEYHHVNALGSVALITDDSENVLVRYEYDVFGAVRYQSGSSDNTRKFTGKEYDADVKLYYYGARYYDPYIGRFISRDPVGDGINWYIYCRNNPLRFIDPTGLELIGEPRPVNDVEMEILVMVFGVWNANILACEIMIQVATQDEIEGMAGEDAYMATDSSNTIYVPEGYDPSSPDMWGAFDAASFAHEATHVWQNTQTVWDIPEGDSYDYSALDLWTLSLTNEQQAAAVYDWVYVAWGFSHCGFTWNGSTSTFFPYNSTYQFIRRQHVFLSRYFGVDVRSNDFVFDVVLRWYNPLLRQLRLPLNWLGQNFPNPA